MRPDQWLATAGYLTWIASGIPTVMAIGRREMTASVAIGWACAYLLFGAAFGGVCRWRQGRRSRRVLIAVQSLAGLAMVLLTRDVFPAVTLVVVAAQLLDVFDARGATLWLVAQTTVLVGAFWLHSSAVTALIIGASFAGFETFALATAALAHRERRAREALSRVNAELVATRSLLAEDSRVAERLRISRDLHDAIGHHLTALSLQLEVASRLSSGQAATHIAQAHAVTRLLLSDVRDVVSQLRETSRLDLAAAMRALASGAGPLEVDLQLPDPFEIDDPAQAHALLRCVQEIITNATRHAAAQHLWIRLEQRREGIDLHARDDGRGAPDVKWGNGLSGMRERFEQHAGHIEFTPGAGHGFEVHGFMPASQAAS